MRKAMQTKSRSCSPKKCPSTTPVLSSLVLSLLLCLCVTAVRGKSSSAVPLVRSTTSSSSLLLPLVQIQQDLLNLAPKEGIVVVITSPGTPTALIPSDNALDDDQTLLSVDISTSNPVRLLCRGSTSEETTQRQRSCLAVASIVASDIVVDGVTTGDVESGFSDSRHARTLTALFQARLRFDRESNLQKQRLIISVSGTNADNTAAILLQQVKALYHAAAAGTRDAASFNDLYEAETVLVSTPADAQKVLVQASESAKRSLPPEGETLYAILSQAFSKVQTAYGATRVPMMALDPPVFAQAFVRCDSTYTKLAKTAQAQLTAWKHRVARGLLVDRFGEQATELLEYTSQQFDAKTLVVAGWPVVASHRRQLRQKLIQMMHQGIEELYDEQVLNLESVTLKRLEKQLLRNAADSASAEKTSATSAAEQVMDADAASARKAFLAFEKAAKDLDVPSLGLSAEKAVRSMSPRLNDAVKAFPDSPAAKLQRAAAMKRVVQKEKKPGQRGWQVGLDLVAMFRPDGYGSLQGFAGYQLPGGNSVTVGVQNDADDPTVIAQFGGVRPPLVKVQPKLRVDVEM